MTRRRLGSVLAAAAMALAVAAPAAHGSGWIQVACVNPDGSAAPSEGWTSGAQGSPGVWSTADTVCQPGTPMSADLSYLAPSSVGDEFLQYTPPAGSTLVGGTLDANLYADGYGTASGAYDAAAYSALYEPDFVESPSDVPFQCVFGFGCSGHPDAGGVGDFSGQIPLTADRGGDLWVVAGCNSGSGGSCNENGQSHQAWALAQVAWAHLVLSSNVAPQGSGFSGSALQPNARGTGHVVFTAGEPSGPGIYAASVAIDGATVWSATPNTNGGECVPVGSDPTTGFLMFDYQQPCLTSEVVDAPVPTAGLSDGSHELTITVTDAAGNQSTVFDQTITTSNPQLTPTPRGKRTLHAEFVISWRWSGAQTRLRSISVRNLARDARIAVGCSGPHCPRLRVRSEPGRHAGKLLRALAGRQFAAGDRLRITVTAPRDRAERIQLQMRAGGAPLASLLKS